MIHNEVDFEAEGKHTGFLRLAHSTHQSAYGWIPIPVASVRNGVGPTVLVMAGNHGDEYEGQVLASQLVRELQPNQVRGQVIVLPMAKGGIAASAVLCFIFSWTEFLFVLTLTQTSLKTVPVVSSTFVTSIGTAWGNMAALGAAAIIPAFIVVLLVQRHLVRGLTMGSLKQ